MQLIAHMHSHAFTCGHIIMHTLNTHTHAHTQTCATQYTHSNARHAHTHACTRTESTCAYTQYTWMHVHGRETYAHEKGIHPQTHSTHTHTVHLHMVWACSHAHTRINTHNNVPRHSLELWDISTHHRSDGNQSPGCNIEEILHIIQCHKLV